MRSRFDADVQRNSGDTVDSCGPAHVSDCSLGLQNLRTFTCSSRTTLFELRWSCARGSARASDSHISRTAVAPLAESRNSSPLLRGLCGYVRVWDAL